MGFNSQETLHGTGNCNLICFLCLTWQMCSFIFWIQLHTQIVFLPTCPPRGAWVFRWTFSPPPPLLLLSHLQSLVSLRYITFLLGTENAMGGGGGVGPWQCMSSCLFIIYQLEIRLFSNCEQFWIYFTSSHLYLLWETICFFSQFVQICN